MKRCMRDEQEYHAKKRRVNGYSLLELPELIIINILSRLPIETIFSCRSVCKTFNNFLNDPYFAQVHLNTASNSNRCLIIQNLVKTSDNFVFTDMINLEKLSSPWMFDCPLAAISQPIQPNNVLSSMLVGSCNGLIFLAYHVVIRRSLFMMFCVCNPILGEFVIIPPPWDYGLECIPFLGFCPKTKKYKVIRFSSNLFTEIHTLGTNFWRKIDNIPHPKSYVSYFLDCSFLNGSLPFLTRSFEVSRMICSFNFETEQYLYIPPPTHFFVEEARKRIDLNSVVVGLLDGLFCISYRLNKLYFEVYVMQKYSVKESWSKKVTIDMMSNLTSARSPNHSFIFTNIGQLRGISLLSNGDMLISLSCCRILFYSPRNGTIRDILHLSREENERDRLYGHYYAIDFVPSFISMKDIGVESVGVIQRSKRHNL